MKVEYTQLWQQSAVKTELTQFIAGELNTSYSEGTIERVQDGVREVIDAFARLVDVLVEKGVLDLDGVKTIMAGSVADFSGQLHFICEAPEKVDLTAVGESDPNVMAMNAIKAFKQLDPGETMTILTTSAPMEMEYVHKIVRILNEQLYVERHGWAVTGREYVVTRSQKEKPND